MKLISTNIEKHYHDQIVKFEGSRNQTLEIFAFTLSTCMWCALGKKWLKERGYSFSYLDIDKITIKERNQLKSKLKEITGNQLRFPLLIIDKKKWCTGYEPLKWEEFLNE